MVTAGSFYIFSLIFRAEVALQAARAAIVGGISVLEVVMSTPGVFEVIQQLVKEHPEMAVGVGTVLKVEDAKTAIKAGAKFLMSPAIVKDIMDYVQCTESLYIPGAMTPTEILSAYETGAKIIKKDLLDELVSTQRQRDELHDDDLKELISRVLSHYEQYYQEKFRIAIVAWGIEGGG
ncbi:hypothetical protein K1719_020276 [Acacia pycnantha]|nr:hypothetical protein K1719_020276 [Acacia pycnantha]